MTRVVNSRRQFLKHASGAIAAEEAVCGLQARGDQALQM